MKIMGIDPSSHTGWVVIDDAKPGAYGVWSGTLHHKKGAEDTVNHEVHRLAKYRADMGLVLHRMNPDLVVIEGPAYNVRSNTSVLINSINAVIKLCVYDAGVPMVEAFPTTLKKFVTGTGRSSKSVIIKKVYMNWGFDTNDDNIADAYGLAQIGLMLVHGDGPAPKFRVDSLKLVRKKYSSVIATLSKT